MKINILMNSKALPETTEKEVSNKLF